MRFLRGLGHKGRTGKGSMHSLKVLVKVDGVRPVDVLP